MRALFAKTLLRYAKKDKQISLLTGDLGFGMWDEFRDTLPDQFINCGASEQAMLDIAVGLALVGKKPFVYTITPFFYRAFETLRTYINHENINVKLIGSGRDKSYIHDGFSHDATDFKGFLDLLPNIKQYWPEEKEEIPSIVKDILQSDKPSCIILKR